MVAFVLMFACSREASVQPNPAPEACSEQQILKKPAMPEVKNEHAIIINFKYGLPGLSALREAEKKIESAINKAGAGEYDGDEIAVDLTDGYLYLYGPDADRLFEAIRPVLESTPFMKGAVVKLRYGPIKEGVRENTIKIGEGR